MGAGKDATKRLIRTGNVKGKGGEANKGTDVTAAGENTRSAVNKGRKGP